MSEHVKSLISDSILYNLRKVIAGNTITTPNGTYAFKQTLREVTDVIKDAENFTEFPACNVIYGKERCDNADMNGILQVNGTNRQILENTFELFLHVFAKAEDPRLTLEQILCDVQTLFGNNTQLIGSTGNAEAFTILYSESEPFLLRGLKMNCALEMKFIVHYRQRREDPTQKI